MVLTKDIATIPISQLGVMLGDSDGLEYLKTVLRTKGSLAVTDLPAEFSDSLSRLESRGRECLRDEQYPQFHLPDGSVRQTLARDSEHLQRFVQSQPSSGESSVLLASSPVVWRETTVSYIITLIRQDFSS